MFQALLFGGVVPLLIFTLVSPAVAVTLNPGDILVADAGSRKLIRIDPATGAQTIVAQGGLLEPVFNPRGLTIDTDGNILVSDTFCCGQSRILKVDATTGTQTILSSGGLLPHAYGIAIDLSGNILVSDLDIRGLIQVNPFNGSQTAFALGGFFESPKPIAIRPNGDIFVADGGGITGISSIIRVDPITKAQTKISSGGLLTNPEGMAIDTNGNIFVANIYALGVGAILQVNPVTGEQTQIASRFSPGSFIELPISLAVDSNDNILIADEVGRVVRLNPETGDQIIVAEGGNLNIPFAIAVIPQTQIIVLIDIKPDGFPNSINPRSQGKIQVAILTTDTFDAVTVDETTVLFGATGTEAAPVKSALKDVDGDGDTDMILHFNTQDMDIQCGDISASLTGQTFSGQVIEGSDAIKTVGCK